MAQTVELGEEGSPRGQKPGPGVDPLIGQHLLHYRVVEVIGQGGMSVVYRGHDENLKRDVAIKVLHPFLAEKSECRQRLAREARAVARLEHPHILKVFDFSGDPDTIDERPSGNRVRGFAEGFIVAELVRGSTLKRYAEQHELWDCPEVGAMVLWQIASALEHAHANGVVHRDLKPENVMVRDDGWLKLMDFGIAQITDQKGLTITGTLLGSPAHMAPECIDGHPADERSDIFSLGTVLYWITTGSLPFEALTPHALLKQIVEGRTMPAQQRSPRISDDLGRVIAKAMATKPAERFENAGALVAALAEVLEKAGLAAEPARLRTILASPDVELPRATSAVRAAFLHRARQALDDGAHARALACLNRVLAEDQDDADARALLEKVQDEPPAAVTPAETTDDGAPAPSDAVATTVPTATALRPPDAAEPSALPRLLRQAALVVVAAALIAGAVVLAVRFDDGAHAPPPPPVAAPPAPPDPAPIELGSPAEPAMAPAEPAPRRPRVEKPDPAKTARTEAPKPEAAPAATTRAVTLRAKPWADIFVDGKQIATGVPRFTAQLAPGHHVIRFVNAKAYEQTRQLDVSDDATVPVPDVAAELQSKPGFVAVQCNVKDAVVAIGDQSKTAAESAAAPLVVHLGNVGKAHVVVDVVKKGFVPQQVPVDVEAAQTKTLYVTLKPE